MPQITNGTTAFDPDELDWFFNQYGTTEWAVYFPGMDEVTTRNRHYPGDEVKGEPFTVETVRAYLAEFDARFGPGSPMAREVHEPSYAVALHYGKPAFGSHQHSYPVQPPNGSLAHPGNCACGAPYADVEAEQQRKIAVFEWAVHVAGVGVLARPDNNPAHPLFTEETARQYAAWANTEMAWLRRDEPNAAVVLHYGVPVEMAGA